MSASGDRGDIILGWLTRVVCVLALVGVLSFDTLAIGATRVSLADQAGSAARAASETWKETRNLQRAYDAAAADALLRHDDNLVDTDSFRIDSDGTVHVRLDRTVDTLVVRHLRPLRDLAKVTADGAGRFLA